MSRTRRPRGRYARSLQDSRCRCAPSLTALIRRSRSSVVLSEEWPQRIVNRRRRRANRSECPKIAHASNLRIKLRVPRIRVAMSGCAFPQMARTAFSVTSVSSKSVTSRLCVHYGFVERLHLGGDRRSDVVVADQDVVLVIFAVVVVIYIGRVAICGEALAARRINTH
jgi:hypothetical protein